MVTLYNGGLYHLYRYKKYTDVRLVFAPEQAIAGFGGDVDNFEYPRMNLDVGFFRAYENGKPAKTPHYFKWSETGPKENDLVFVTGHPGTTNRLETLAKLKHRRDVTLPYTLYRLRTLEAALTQYGEQSPEKQRQAATDLHSVANARKAFSGQLQGLLDPKIMEQKADSEQELLDATNPGRCGAERSRRLAPDHGRIDDGPDASSRASRSSTALLETGDAFQSSCSASPGTCVRMAEELPKKRPSGSASTATPTSNR